MSRFVPSIPSPAEKRRMIKLIREKHPGQADIMIADLESSIKDGWYLVERPPRPDIPRVGNAPQTE